MTSIATKIQPTRRGGRQPNRPRVAQTVGICEGRPYLAGTRITVEYLGALWQKGMRDVDILDAHRTLKSMHLDVAREYLNRGAASRAKIQPPSADKLVLALALERKTVANGGTGRDPPPLPALMDRARTMLLSPESCNASYLTHLREDLVEAEACLKAVRDAVENAPKIQR